jgi:tetratricopeptide (TPR) repeat protein
MVVAVLPHMPLEQITFDPTHEAVQIATELRQKFKSMARTEVRSPVDVDRALRRVKAANVAPENLLQALAHQLRADYVVWGSLRRSQGIVQATSAVYSMSDGQKLIETPPVLTSSELPENQLASTLVSRLSLTRLDQKRAPDLFAVFAQLRNNPTLNAQLITPVANTVESRSDLLTGFESLEQALAYPTGDPAGVALLNQSEQALARAAEKDARNPFTHLLMANCYFNQAQAASSLGRTEEAKERSKLMVEALRRAFRERDNSPVDLLKIEIQADHSLLVTKKYGEAIKYYQQLATAPNDATLHTALRAHWMLAGIYSGDWGVEASVIDPKLAREHLITVLAHWPDSAEATFIKTNLRWSEEKGRNQFENFPRQNQAALPDI